MQAEQAERRFRAMGSDCHVIVVATSGAAAKNLVDQALDRIDELESRWSRFISDSEISRLNDLAGHPVIVSHDTFRLVKLSVEAWWRTAGRFDPTVHSVMLAHGYNRDFDQLPQVPRGQEDVESPGGSGSRSPAPGCFDIELEPALSAVTLPTGAAIDPGGIGKGLAGDLVTAELITAGAEGALANLGGDIRVRGSAPGGGAWPIAVEEPTTDRRVGMSDPLSIEIADGAVVTSSRLRRQWTQDRQSKHHLIDPATGQPTSTDVVGATVVANDGWWAEVETKVLITAGVRDGLTLIRDAEAIVHDVHGGRHVTAAFERVLS